MTTPTNDNSAQIAALEVEVRYMRQTLDRVAIALDKLAVIEARLQRLDALEAEIAGLRAFKFQAVGALAIVPLLWSIVSKKLGF